MSRSARPSCGGLYHAHICDKHRVPHARYSGLRLGAGRVSGHNLTTLGKASGKRLAFLRPTGFSAAYLDAHHEGRLIKRCKIRYLPQTELENTSVLARSCRLVDLVFSELGTQQTSVEEWDRHCDIKEKATRRCDGTASDAELHSRKVHFEVVTHNYMASSTTSPTEKTEVNINLIAEGFSSYQIGKVSFGHLRRSRLPPHQTQLVQILSTDSQVFRDKAARPQLFPGDPKQEVEANLNSNNYFGMIGTDIYSEHTKCQQAMHPVTRRPLSVPARLRRKLVVCCLLVRTCIHFLEVQTSEPTYTFDAELVGIQSKDQPPTFEKGEFPDA
ncbi:hypothetical protein QBC44DRAFT_306687 [Cladorrhinum sp. PSN332]|nr:hypothetical protein QBC44DRAFT_306687 [Cladorrhinum sp. PSN332]